MNDGHYLLTISTCFEFAGGRIFILPDFPIKDGLPPYQNPMNAMIFNGNKELKPCQVSVHISHFNIPTSTDPEKRWRLTLELEGIRKSKIESGDQLHIFNRALAKYLTSMNFTNNDETSR